MNPFPEIASVPATLPFVRIAGPLASAEDAVARLDERLRSSPIREGFIARGHFADACAALWLEGELVHLEDLVLHDADKDVRSPTHELTRAHSVLRARRRIAGADPGWALTEAGLSSLRGKGGEGEEDAPQERERDAGADPGATNSLTPEAENDTAFDAIAAGSSPELAAAMNAADAAIAHADHTIAEIRRRERDPLARDPLAYDLDWDEDQRLDEWRRRVDEGKSLPPTLAAAALLEAWHGTEPLQHQPWLGELLSCDLLRERRKSAHLACLNLGLRLVPRERRRTTDKTTRLIATLEALTAAARAGLKDHDRWLNARNLLARKLKGRRSTSHLPGLIDYVMSRPLVSAAMIAQELKITTRAAQSLVTELGLREVTGRGSYRAWGIL